MTFPFSSEAARQRYLDRIAQRTASWPVPFEEHWVEDDWGRTFVRVSGPVDAPPLVLFPPTSCTSLFYARNIQALTSAHRVYAVDHIYDFGLSVTARPLKTEDDLIGWLLGVLDGLELTDPVDVLGTSYGAWMTALLAVRQPSRVRHVVLIAPPATILPFPVAWIFYGVSSLIPHRSFLRRMQRWMFPVLSASEDPADQAEGDELFEDAWTGMRCYVLKQPVAPRVLTDDELASIQTPTLFLVGEHEVLYPADQALERLQQVAPQIQAERIDEAGHDLTLVRSEAVTDRVLTFLTTPTGAGR